jgi:hypothetical protein
MVFHEKSVALGREISVLYIRGLLQKSWQLIFFGQTRYSEESSKYTYERA